MTDASEMPMGDSELATGEGEADEVVWEHETELTLVFPPFASHPGTAGGDLRPHDASRARRFVEALSTVAAVLDEGTEISLSEAVPPYSPAGFGYVAVGCWGNVVHLVDPALLSLTMEEEVAALRKLHPEARIAGETVERLTGQHHGYVLAVPGAGTLHAGSWDGESYEVEEGDLSALLRALGPGEDMEGEDLLGFGEVNRLAALVHTGFDDIEDPDSLRMSVFRVRHTEDAEDAMDELWRYL
ncbi:DUF6333 family protein [Streptomyces sp. 3N207]|uniref:DUF6333 family protein n=1 Tax=Streptomyces sp. 3N207 TaxID=3457417 RepID=UPI003FD11446